MEEKLNRKIVLGLERLSDAFKVMLWEKAKAHGISPIQIQILLFVANHKAELCSVSHLAKEFNVTKPTISDAVRVLDKKGFLQKDYSQVDSRSYTLGIAPAGKKLTADLNNYAQPLEKLLDRFELKEQSALYQSLTQLIFQLNRSGVLSVQRTCFGCRFYENKSGIHHCHFLQKNLIESAIRLDCPEFEARN